jgi:5-methylcytosine-specific restriction endonuclease McrA
MEIVTCDEAKARGLSRYFTGKPCTRGHIAQRQVSSGSCVECHKITVRRHYEQNREAYLERAKASYAADKPKGIQRSKEWAAANKDWIKALKALSRARRREALRKYHAQWCKDNAERLREVRKKWADDNRERVRLLGRVKESRRRERKDASGEQWTADDAERIMDSQRGKCACCGIKLRKFHVDHIIPLARGGSNAPDNIQILCPPCNMNKRALDPITFMQQRGFLL